MSTQISEEIAEIIRKGRFDGDKYFLPPDKLERSIYSQVNKVISDAGGKWNTKAQAHIFEDGESDRLQIALNSGVSHNIERAKRKLKPETFRLLHTLRMENDAHGQHLDELRPRFDRLAARHENGTAPRAVVAHQLFQTPPDIAAQLVALLALRGGERVLEPSAGLGRILDALAPQEPCEIVAVESAPQCAGELFRQNRSGVQILQRDFLTLDPEETGLFDAVAMNPPFTMRSDIAHCRHALSFLRKGGRLAAVLLNTHHRADAFKAGALAWIELPAGAFAKEGTHVPTVLALLEN